MARSNAKASELHPDQLQALKDYETACKKLHPKKPDEWKNELAIDWSQAGSRIVSDDTYSVLHGLRNQHGPDWLINFELHPVTFTHYAHTANSWGAGTSIDGAFKRLQSEASADWLKKHGHEIVEFSKPLTRDQFTVNDVNGTLSVPGGVTVKVVEKHRPIKKYRV